MAFITTLRTIVFSLSFLFGLVIIGLDANRFSGPRSFVWPFEITCFLAGTFTVLMMPTLLIVGKHRQGAFISMIVVELPILGILWLLWLISSILASQYNIVDASRCRTPRCHQFYAIEALSFLIWIMLFLYAGVLLTCVFVAKSRGNDTWQQSVGEANFFKRTEGQSQATPPMKGTPSSLESGMELAPVALVLEPVVQTPSSSQPIKEATSAQFPPTPLYPQPQA